MLCFLYWPGEPGRYHAQTMAAKQDTPESLTALVGDALAQLDDKVTGWTHEFDRNRVHFRGTGPDFALRDKGGFFTITYKYHADEKTTKHYIHEHAVALMLKLFHRKPV